MAEEAEVPAATTQVVVNHYHVDENTGRITVSVKCCTKHGSASWDGPSKQYSVDIQMFRDRFNGDIAAYEAYVAAEHRSISGPPIGLVDALKIRKGRIIG